MMRVSRTLAMVLMVLVLAMTACSPEAARTRNSGPGADIGNRQPQVDMHGQQSPYYQTPRSGTAVR